MLHLERSRFSLAAAALCAVAGALFVTGAGAQARVAATWGGNWKTNWGTLTIVQSGSRLTGSYTHDKGKLVATVSGLTATGTWSESPTYKGPKDAGAFVLTLAADGKSFAGHWRYTSSKAWSGTWHGTLVPVAAVGWTGQWSSNWGVMTVTQSGSAVTGSYTHDSGKIQGTVSGLTLTGTWSESPTYAGPTDAGPFVLTLSPDGLSFSGKWAYEGQTPDSNWTGSRLAV